jgi:predicted oxidoreductase
MKKKKLKISTEKAFEVVNNLKANVEILKEKGEDTVFIKTLEASVKKMDRLEKELVTLKEKLKTKKSVFEQEKELTLELISDAQKVLKKEMGIKLKADKKQKPKKEGKKLKQQVDEVAEVVEKTEDPT